MTDKELRKLRRSELLEMLLEQKKAVAAAEKRLEEERTKRAEVENQFKELDETYQRLRKKLDDKDEKIHQLRAQLESIAESSPDRDSINKVTARLTKAVEVMEKAAGKIQKKP